MADVILKNNTKHPKRMIIFNLTRELAPVKVMNRITVETRDGERRTKMSSKLVPDSIRIPYGGESLPIPEEYLQVREIAAAIEKREVLVVSAPRDAGPKPTPKPVEPVGDVPEKGKERKRR